MKSMRFVHLTDTHMNAPSSDGPFAKFKLAEKVKQTCRHIQEANIAPAFVLITGDLSHEGDAADYAYIRTVLDECSALVGAPVHVVLGNHDHRSAFRQGYLGETPSEEAYYYSHDIDGLRLIGLNSQTPGRHDGEIDAAQLAWLSDELAQPAPLGTIVAIHHPMMSVRGMPGDHLLANRAQLGEVLAGTDVIGVMAGHVHSNNVGTYRGIVNVAAAGTAFTGEMADADNYKMVNFCGYNVVDVSEEGISIQTTVLPTSNEEYFRFPIAALAVQH
ncbi:metallophosphoesterase family protein [Cohnella sp. 56]|uniref:metallophosphoesterase family protein n=1 Tax=Cohnella sp. 56 TaxID=3113722 RepID=UPI0030EAA57F